MADRRKLIELALPLDAINAGARADKNRKTGTIRSIHKWFAPMPSAAVRGVLYAALVDAPDDPKQFNEVMSTAKALVASGAESPPDAVLDRARADIAASFSGDPPAVLDPFCGGGSTGMEAQRLGLHSVLSDLNPVAVVTTMAVTQSLPAFASREVLSNVSELVGREVLSAREGFGAAVQHFAGQIYEDAREALIGAYPTTPDGETVLAWRWCRTVRSPDPAYSDVEVPLVRDWWFSRRDDQRGFAVPIFDPDARSVGYRIESNGEPPFANSNNRCVLSGAPITFKYLRDEGKAKGLGVACFGALVEKGGVRSIRPPVALTDAGPHSDESSAVSVRLPDGGLGFRVQAYGLEYWADLFLPRQRRALTEFASLVNGYRGIVREQLRDANAAGAVIRVLGLCVGRMASYSSAICKWRIDTRSGVGQPEGSFEQAVLPMRWDFVETNPIGGSRGDWMVVVSNVISGFSHVPERGPLPVVFQGDARRLEVPEGTPVTTLTDPPYFDQIGYADLSDYFYPWIRLAISDEEPELFSTVAAPKADELVADASRHSSPGEAEDAFRSGFRQVFGRLRDLNDPRVPLLVVYALRQAESRSAADAGGSTGWDEMLTSLIESGLSVVGTWPIQGTGSTRQRAQKSSALATYVLMVCRPRGGDAPRVSAAEFVAALRSELPDAIRLLQAQSIAPVDMAQSAIGPGMAVFSRYSEVVEADGEPMAVRRALVLINEVLQEVLSEEETEFDGDTRWALTWFEQNGLNPGPFGDADTLSKAKNTSVKGVVDSGIAVQREGKVRLKDRDELVAGWDPSDDPRPTVWEATQHLIASLGESEAEAADLLRRLGSERAERARQLSYLLYQVADRKGWAEEAVAYNGLVQAWPEISRLAGQSEIPIQQTFGGN